MALPTSMRKGLPGMVTKAGVTLDIFPSTVAGLAVELQAATGAAAATSLWSSVILPASSAGRIRYFYATPNSTRPVYFKARHPAQAGYSAGAFTTILNARPYTHPMIQPRYFPALTFKGNVEIPAGSDVYLTSGKTVKVGTQVTTGAINKVMVISYAHFMPETTAGNSRGDFNGALGIRGGTTVAVFFRAHQPLPVGAKLTQLSISGNRKLIGAQVTALISRSTRFATLDSTQFTVTLVSVSTSPTPISSDSSALNYTVGTSDSWHARLTLVNPSTDITKGRLFALRWKYSMPSYDKTI